MTKVDQIQVFCSYSHRDRELRNELAKYLQLLQDSLLIQAWHDGEISAGQDWRREIDDHLAGADVILLLVSIDFLDSEFVRKYELPAALERHRNGTALVIPVLLRPVPWKLSRLSSLQALPRDLRPVIEWIPPELAYVNICEGLFSAVLAWRAQTVPPQPAAPRRSTNVRRRVLDLAISRRVPVGKATFLAVMVRRVGERGLRAVLETNDRYGIRPEEVESGDSFPLEFPRRADGQLSSLDLTIEVVSGDFRCRDPRKNLSVPPRGDSPICVFLLEAVRAGPVRVTVEVTYRGSIIRTHVLGSEGVPGAAPFEPTVEEIPGFEGAADDDRPTQMLLPKPASSFPANPQAQPAPSPEWVESTSGSYSAPASVRASRPRTFVLILAGLLVVLALGALAWYLQRPSQ